MLALLEMIQLSKDLKDLANWRKRTLGIESSAVGNFATLTLLTLRPDHCFGGLSGALWDV